MSNTHCRFCKITVKGLYLNCPKCGKWLAPEDGIDIEPEEYELASMTPNPQTNTRFTNKDLVSDFDVTIQFHRVNGIDEMTLTTNHAEPIGSYNMRLFGMGLATNSTQLKGADHEGLQAFCVKYLKHRGYTVR